jgi:hypothetical protein
MLFSELPFPPAVLTHIGDTMFDACRRLSQVEADALLEAQTATSVTETMITSFGHDGKRPASIIELLLNSPEPSAHRLAHYLAHSLVARLESYSRFDVRERRTEDIQNVLVSEANITRHWISLQKLWQQEALSQVIRIFTDGSVWADLRQTLFPQVLSWETVEHLFEPVLKSTASGKSEERMSGGADDPETQVVLNLGLLNPPIHIWYDGPALDVPTVLDGREGSPTRPLLATVLRFAFAELMTNAGKHVFGYASNKMKIEGICYSLVVSLRRDGYYLEASFSPSPDWEPNTELLGMNRTTTGLTSLKLALRSIGTHAQEKSITSCENGNIYQHGTLPYPSLRESFVIRNRKTNWYQSIIGPIHPIIFRQGIL